MSNPTRYPGAGRGPCHPSAMHYQKAMTPLQCSPCPEEWHGSRPAPGRRFFSWLTIILLTLPLPALSAPVQEVVTPGGIKAWLVEEHSLPLVAVKILFKNAGSAYDPVGREGRGELASDLLLEGAGEMNSYAFHEALESNAINLSTSVDADHFTVTLETLSEHREKAFSLMGMALTQPRFDADAIERIRAQAQSTLLRLQQNPGYQLARAWQTTAFGIHPYAKPEKGSKESLTALTREDFAAYREHYLTRANMLVAVVGDITPAELSALLDAHLSALPTAYQPDTEVPDTVMTTQTAPVMVQNDIPQTLVSFGGTGIRRNDPKYFDAFVMNYILGGSGSLISRLGLAIREEKGLTYSVNTELDPMQHTAAWTGSFATRNDQVAEALTTLKTALQAFRARGITDKELTEAKQYLTGSFLLSLDSNADVANFLIAMQLHGLGRDYLDKRNAMVQAVTKEGVNRMIERLIDPAHLLVVMVGAPKGLTHDAPTANP